MNTNKTKAYAPKAMKEKPNPGVMGWLSTCPADAIFTTAICYSEIIYGVRRLPDGQKR
jgi:hypothetical protein